MICFEPIGVIRTPFTQAVGMPLQSVAAVGVQGTIEVDARYRLGLCDLDGFSHLILLYHLHQIVNPKLEVTPFLDNQTHGIFATRSPQRPNAIGLSVVKLLRVEGNLVYIEEIDVVDGTPLLDIKPYVPQFDVRITDRIGWFANRVENVDHVRADRGKLGDSLSI